MRLSLSANFDAPTRAEEEANHESLRSLVRSEIGSNCATNSMMRVACPFCMFPRFPRAPRTMMTTTVQQDELSVEEEVTLMRPRREEGGGGRTDRVRRRQGGVTGRRRRSRSKKNHDEPSRPLNRVEIWVLVLCLFACEIFVGLFTFWAAGANGGAILLLHIPSYMAVGAFICNAFTAAPTTTAVEDPERQPLLGEGRRQRDESVPRELVFEWRRSV